MMTDSQTLLADYAQNGTEAAFRELVTRYLDFVYSTAFRFVGNDAHLAQDVAQIVFTDLARKARSLPKGVLLGGWLHRHTCFVAGKTMRTQRRRQAREQQAVEMNALREHSEPDLNHLGPVLDEAINQLGEADRTAVLLRFFERHDFRSIGQALGTNEDAAQKRVSRALDKLHSLLQHRGVSLSAAALGTVLSAQAVTAAPPGLAAVIGGTAVASAVASGGITATFLQIMAMTKLKLGIIGAVVVAGLAVPVLIHHASSPAVSGENLAPAQPESGAESDVAIANVATRSTADLVAQLPSPAQGLPIRSAPGVASFRALDEILKGRRLTAEQAQALESKLAQEPEDVSARCQLIGYYWGQQIASKSAREARQDHVAWFIQNRPEMKLQAYGGLDPLQDERVYGRAKTLWLQQATANPQNPAILGNAAAFCLLYDRTTAEELLRQAQLLEPTNPAWSKQLAHLYSLSAHSSTAGEPNQAAAKAFEQMENAHANTTGELQRFHNLNDLAQMAFEAGEAQKAQAYATALLQQAAQPKEGWDYGEAIFRGNLILGRIALHNGEIEAAKQYLLASATTTGSPVLGSFGPNMTLAKELLEQGEKAVVLQYFDLCAKFWKNEKLALWTQHVNQGWMPEFGANLTY